MAINYKLAAQIQSNIEDEADAVRGYMELLAAEGLAKSDKEVISEIVSDEKNHILLLQALVRGYDGDIAPAPDDLKPAIREITAQ